METLESTHNQTSAPPGIETDTGTHNSGETMFVSSENSDSYESFFDTPKDDMAEMESQSETETSNFMDKPPYEVRLEVPSQVEGQSEEAETESETENEAALAPFEYKEVEYEQAEEALEILEDDLDDETAPEPEKTEATEDIIEIKEDEEVETPEESKPKEETNPLFAHLETAEPELHKERPPVAEPYQQAWFLQERSSNPESLQEYKEKTAEDPEEEEVVEYHRQLETTEQQLEELGKNQREALQTSTEQEAEMDRFAREEGRGIIEQIMAGSSSQAESELEPDSRSKSRPETRVETRTEPETSTSQTAPERKPKPKSETETAQATEATAKSEREVDPDQKEQPNPAKRETPKTSTEAGEKPPVNDEEEPGDDKRPEREEPEKEVKKPEQSNQIKAERPLPEVQELIKFNSETTTDLSPYEMYKAHHKEMSRLLRERQLAASHEKNTSFNYLASEAARQSDTMLLAAIDQHAKQMQISESLGKNRENLQNFREEIEADPNMKVEGDIPASWEPGCQMRITTEDGQTRIEIDSPEQRRSNKPELNFYLYER